MPSVSGPKILICGYFGFGNVGDEAILEASLRSFRQRDSETSFTVLSGDPAQTSADHSVTAVPWRSPARLIEAVRHSDLVVIGGGGLFHDYWGTDPTVLLTRKDWGISYFTSPAFVAAIERTPTAIVGVGVGPLAHEESRRLVRSACEIASSLSVRDEASRELLVAIGVLPEKVILTADLGFLLSPGAPAARERQSPRVGVALRHWTIGAGSGWEREIAAALDDVLDACGGTAVLLPFQTIEGDLENDVAIAGRIRSIVRRAERVEIARVATPAEALRQISACDVVLGMRLHAIVLAAGCGIPPVALAYDPKVRAMMERLGLSEFIVPLSEARRGDVTAKVLAALERAPAMRPSLLARAAAEKTQAGQNAAIALEALGRRPAGPFSEETEGVLAMARERIREERDEAVSGSAPVQQGAPRSGENGSGSITTGSLAPYDVLILPIISWDFRFQRPQQLATQFARHGHRVYYLSLTQFLPPDGRAWELLGKAPNVAELQLRASRRPDIYSERLEVADVDVLEESLACFFRDKQIDKVACIVEIPFWTSLALRVRGRWGSPVVYDCMDEWTNFPGLGPEVLGFESVLVREADLTVVSSARLAEKWGPTARRLILARNGIDLAHYVSHYGPGDLLANVKRPVIGYFGALAAWVDVDLLVRIAQDFPEATLVLVGGQFDVDLARLAALPNVRIIDQRPYSEIPALLWEFDVCLIPFQINAITEATDPVKFYEYCFSGKPIVATDLPELRRFAGVCYLARGHDEFIDQVRRALSEPSGDPLRMRRREIAAENGWERRYQQIDRALRIIETEGSVAVRRDTLEQVERRLDAMSAAAKDASHREGETSRNIARLRGEVETLQSEVRKMTSSRIWKLGEVYWGALRLFGRHSPAPAPETAAAAPVPAPEAPETAPDDPLVGARKALLTTPARYDVVCLPIVDWDFRFQRPQQLMSRFAAAGHRVFYVSLQFRQTGPSYRITPKATNVFEISLRGPDLNVYRDTLGMADGDRLAESFDAARKDLGIGAASICVQLPFWWPLARRLKAAFAWPIVYDCMDHHAGFSTNRPAMVAEEAELKREADLVIASSRLLEIAAREANGNVMLVRNGCDYDHFADAQYPAEPSKRPVIGYYGAIADWFDSDLVGEIARLRPGWDIVLVGSTFSADVSRLRKMRNVSLPGEKPYAEIPRWLARFDVAIIPFKRLPLTEATNPVKAYEIFAAGKPLVAVPLPEIVEMAPHVRLASTAEEFVAEIESALANPRDESAARREFARENTWAKRFEELAPAIASLFPRVSVVVVTFGNRELNRLCIESLHLRTAWPNVEVIVVDNASEDGTRDLLRRFGEDHPEMRVILNDRNLGFAAANNQGLRMATGEFLVLLNNDTIVSRGWLSALIRHLHRDPTIGLIGAVTNAIGNEAMIPVGYEHVEDIPTWAAEYVREHDGETFEIPMLAMFCVAMRRSVHESLGPLDERFGVGMFEDDDYARRARESGLRIVCARDSFVHHWMRASFAKMPEEQYRALFENNRRLFEEKWGTPWIPHGGPVIPTPPEAG
jgi:polysaccharide pyruvyl transferase CsaB